MEDIALEAPRRRFARRRVDPQRLVVETISEHADSLLRVARRHTGNEADAEDAYQRALEIFVRSAERLDPATVHKWLHTVVKREAWAVREQRAKLVGVEDDGVLDALDDGRHLPTVEERSERFEELTRAAEALGRLKPQEVTALWLKAQGLSYAEIAERQGWTYTKVNRCLTEGRRSFLERFAGIESGAECARWTPVLSAIADGEASAETLLEVRPHLRNCASCRSLLAGMRSAPVAALLPPALLGSEAVAGGGLLDRLGELVLTAQERVVAPLVRAHGTLEMAGAAKVAAVAASAAAIAGGGVAVERSASDGDARAADRPRIERAARTTPVSPPPAPDPSGAALARESAAPGPPRRDAGRDPVRAREGGRDAEAAKPVVTPGAEFAAEAPPPRPEPARTTSSGHMPAEADAPAEGPRGPAGDEFGFGG